MTGEQSTTGLWAFAAIVFLGTATATLAVLLWQSERGGDADGDPLDLDGPGSQALTQPLTEEERRNVEIFRRVAPSVVHVNASGAPAHLLLDQPGVVPLPDSVGSGLVWNDRGYIVTCYHVIRDHGHATKVSLADGSTWLPVPLAMSEEHDLVVLAIMAPPEKLAPIDVGSSTELLVGQKVYAIGNPYGLDHTLTVGVISGLDRNVEVAGGAKISGVIQTDAAINPGNSGGPLLNSSGQLIGVNIASKGSAGGGVGFAVPIETINQVIPEILADGLESLPSVGLLLAADSESNKGLELAGWKEQEGLDFGIVICGVQTGSSAHDAGILPLQTQGRDDIVLGDVIVAVDGQLISSRDDLSRVVTARGKGEEVRLELSRTGQRRTVVLRPVW